MGWIQCGSCGGSGKKYHQAGAAGQREIASYSCSACSGSGRQYVPDPPPTGGGAHWTFWLFMIILGLFAAFITCAKN
jgi:hypothetical protein